MQKRDKFLFVLTSHGSLGDSGERTGFHYNEMAEPFYLLQDHGIYVDLASIEGGQPPADPKSVEEPSEFVLRFMKDEEAQRKLKFTKPIDEIHSDDYLGVYMPGGHGTMWDFPESEALKNVIETAWANQKIIAAVCHGPAAFIRTKKQNGEPLVKGMNVNCYTDEEEKKANKDNVVPFLLESNLRLLGGNIQKGKPDEAYVVQDGRLITGQNSKSAGLVANAILRSLNVDLEKEGAFYVNPALQRHAIGEELRREAVGVFEDQATLDATISELERIAFPRHDISVIGNDHKVEKELGSHSTAMLEDHPDVPRSISVRPEEKTIGTTAFIGCSAYICGTIAAISSGATSSLGLIAAITGGSLVGAAIGATISLLIWRKYRTQLARRIEKGGLILWVRTPDLRRERLAQDIMRKHGGKHVHIHSIA